MQARKGPHRTPECKRAAAILVAAAAAFATALVGGPALAEEGEVRLSGAVTCGDCEGGVGVEAYLGGARGEGALAAVQVLPAPGDFSVLLPEGSGEAYLYAFRDSDGDGKFDVGTEAVAYGSNPVTVADQDLSGLDIDLGTVAPVSVTVSGSVACGDCVGGVGVRVYDSGGLEGGLVVASSRLDAPGAYSLEVPAGAGDVNVYSFRDTDGDSEPDAGTDLAAHPNNPVAVGDEDLVGVDVDLGLLPPTLVKVGGEVTCGDCVGGVGVRLYGPGAADGELIVAIGLEAPGAYEIEVPVGLGEAHVFALRDSDRDGVPDPGTEMVAHASNPLQVAEGDLTEVDVDLGYLPPETVHVTGTVSCGDCSGGVVVQAFGAGGREGGALVAAASLDAPGSFDLEVPAGAGEIFVYAFRDGDGDGLLDPGATLAAHPGNPLSVGLEDVPGAHVDLGTLPAQTVQILGTVSCADCDGGAVVSAYGVGGAESGQLLGVAVLAAPGAYTLLVPIGAGEAHVYARRDADGDGVGDAVTAAVAHAGNPLTVGSEDLEDVDVDLGELERSLVKIGGEVICPDCAGVSAAAYGAGGREGGSLLALAGLDTPGLYTLELPTGSGEVHVFAWRDADRDGQPDPGAEPVPHAGNPLDVAGEDLLEVDVEIEGLLVTSVRISGVVACGDCPGAVRVELFGEGGVEQGSLVDAQNLDAPGEWGVQVAANAGEIFVYAMRDEDKDGRPDPGTDAVAYADNPLVVAEEDIGNVHLDLGLLPDLAVELSGTVLCETCAGGAVVEVYGEGGLLGGVLQAVQGLDAPGPFAVEVARGLGEAWLYGFEDEDRDGLIDDGAVRVPFPDNPVQVGDEDIGGLEVDLLVLPLPDAGAPDADAGAADGGPDPGADAEITDPGVADPGVEDLPEVEEDVPVDAAELPDGADPGTAEDAPDAPEGDTGDAGEEDAETPSDAPADAPDQGADPGEEPDAPAPDEGPVEDAPDVAGAPDEAEDEPGEPSCGCRLGPRSEIPAWSVLFLLAAAFTVVRRRSVRTHVGTRV